MIPGYWTYSGTTWDWTVLDDDHEAEVQGVAIDSNDAAVFAGARNYNLVSGMDAMYWDAAGSKHYLNPAGYTSIEVTGAATQGTDIVTVGRYHVDSDVHTCYWVNDTLHELVGDTPQYARAVAVKGSDILVVGECFWDGVGIWTNGTWKKLPSPDISTNHATAIAVSGADVYVGGEINETGELYGCFWKNGERVDIEGCELVYGIAVE